MHLWILLVGASLAGLLASCIGEGPLPFSVSSESTNARLSAVTDTSVTAGFKVGKDFKVAVEGTSIAGTEVSMNAGALQIPANIYIEEATLSLNSLKSDLNITEEVETASKPLSVQADEKTNLQSPMTLKLPMVSSAGLRLSGTQNFAVLFHGFTFNEAGEKVIKVGIIPSSEFKEVTTKNIVFETLYWGNFTLIKTKSVLEKREKEVKHSPSTKRLEEEAEKTLGPFTLNFENITFDVTKRRFYVGKVTITGEETLVRCEMRFENAAGEVIIPAEYTEDPEELKEIQEGKDDGGETLFTSPDEHYVHLVAECFSASGRNALFRSAEAFYVPAGEVPKEDQDIGPCDSTDPKCGDPDQGTPIHFYHHKSRFSGDLTERTILQSEGNWGPIPFEGHCNGSSVRAWIPFEVEQHIASSGGQASSDQKFYYPTNGNLSNTLNPIFEITVPCTDNYFQFTVGNGGDLNLNPIISGTLPDSVRQVSSMVHLSNLASFELMVEDLDSIGEVLTEPGSVDHTIFFMTDSETRLFPVSTPAELLSALGMNSASDVYGTKIIVFVDDIDFQSHGAVGVPLAPYTFNHIIEGQHFRLKNMLMESDETPGGYLGLFNEFGKYATVKRLALERVAVEAWANKMQMGLLAGFSFQSLGSAGYGFSPHILDVEITSRDMEGMNGDLSQSGVFGGAQNVPDCGLLIGSVDSNLIVNHLRVNDSSVDCSSATGGKAGLLMGKVNNGMGTIDLSDVYIEGSEVRSGSSANVGGLVGFLDPANFFKAYFDYIHVNNLKRFINGTQENSPAAELFYFSGTMGEEDQKIKVLLP